MAIFLIIVGGVVLLLLPGIILHHKGKLTVYLDFKDALFSFLILGLPLFLLFVFAFFIPVPQTLAVILTAGGAALFFVLTVLRTYKNNNGILYFLVALISKLILSFVLAFFVVGKIMDDDEKYKGGFVGIILAWCLLTFKLIRLHVWNAEKVELALQEEED